MRVLLDLQPLQGPSRDRGIGRYTLEHARAFLRLCDDPVAVMNSSDMDAVEAARRELGLSGDRLRVFSLPAVFKGGAPVWIDSCLSGKSAVYDAVLEAFASNLRPDFMLSYSVLEFIGSFSPVKRLGRIPFGAVVYDFIPYHDRKMLSGWLERPYLARLGEMRGADLLFCISEFTALEAEGILGAPKKSLRVIGSGKSPFWKRVSLTEGDEMEFRKRRSLPGPFIMYSGGSDERKNVRRLIEAYASLGGGLVSSLGLFVVCGGNRAAERELSAYAARIGAKGASFAGHVSDEELRAACSLCSLFVFPSLSEGFGLPPLEAMSCGAPTIASNVTSLPEVIGLQRALFDPESVDSIRAKIEEALLDGDFYEELKRHALERSAMFSWDVSAERTMEAIRGLSPSRESYEPVSEEECMDVVAGILRGLRADDRLIAKAAACIADNFDSLRGIEK